jgi:peroxin-12
MATSGFAYCYTCLFPYVQENQKCPITFTPMTTEEIRKLYDEENESDL